MSPYRIAPLLPPRGFPRTPLRRLAWAVITGRLRDVCARRSAWAQVERLIRSGEPRSGALWMVKSMYMLAGHDVLEARGPR